MVRLLLQYDAAPDCVDRKGHSPYIEADDVMTRFNHGCSEFFLYLGACDEKALLYFVRISRTPLGRASVSLTG